MRLSSAFGRDLRGLLPGSAVAFAVWLAAQFLAAAEVEPTFRSETAYLGLLAALVLATVAWAAPRPALEIGAGTPLAVLVLWALPGGPTRAAAMMTVLVAAFVAAAWRAVAAEPTARAGCSWLDRVLRLILPFVPLAVGAQVLLRGRLLVEAAGDPRALAAFWLGGFFAGLAAAVLAARWGAASAAAIAGAVALFAAGFNRLGVLCLVGLAALGELVARLRPRVAGAALAPPAPRGAARALAFALAALFAATALLASPPWLHREPLADAVALVAVRRSGPLLVDGEPVTLDAAHPDRRVVLLPTPVSELVFDTQLTHAAALPAGTPLARFELVDDAGGRHRFVLEAGRHSGEWAALRPDVAARGSAAPAAWRSQLDPSGLFFAQTYRARWRLGRRVRAVQLEVARDSALPAATEIVFHRAELRP